MERLLKRWRSLGGRKALALGVSLLVVMGGLVAMIWVGKGTESDGAQPLRVFGRIVDVGGRSATANLGRKDGVEKGMILEVFRSVPVETDPATGRPTLVKREKIGEMKVADSDEVGSELVPITGDATMPPIRAGDEVNRK